MADGMEQADLVQIGVTPAAEEVLQRMVNKGWFPSEMSAFKAAVAYGMARNIPPTEGGGLQTKWAVGGIDRNGDFLEVVRIFHTGERPWDYVRRIGDAALKQLGPRIELADVPSDLFSDARSE